MIAEAVIVRDGAVLMVMQYVKRGDVVWNFPGGGVEDRETAEQACKREVREETGYDVSITALLCENDGKKTYLAEITGGSLCLDRENSYNEDIIEVGWVSLDDQQKFDAITAPVLKIYLSLES